MGGDSCNLSAADLDSVGTFSVFEGGTGLWNKDLIHIRITKENEN